MSLLIHWYRLAEVYTVVLVWIVVPLGFVTCYLFFNKHYGMFAPESSPNEETVNHAAN